MTDQSTPTRRIRAARLNPEERRAQILDAAVAVFGRQGYRQGSLKTVADEIGLTIQGLLHYFPTKEELLLAALERRNEADQEALDAAYESGGMLESCRHILRRNLERPGFMRLFVTLAAEATDPEHPAHDYFLRRYRGAVLQFKDYLRRDIRAGRLTQGLDADDAASQVIALMDGLQLQYLLRPGFDLIAAFDAAVAPLVED
ncbi:MULTISPECIES: TetR/AcrR family transcriptional regulator [unclassified Microbacterium]|uniref:TetR/AcrR family transcriptional regulator n=1 Tax=unclassified Microbacterium TaxID=2609290 RepID=UPI00364C8486